MKILKRILIGVVSLVVLVAGGGYVYLLTTAPKYSGEQVLSGILKETEVTYDGHGIPHIKADNLYDAYYALGYVHAQDRLFQMEMLRRAAGGRLSEVLGKDLLPVDKLFRTMGLNVFAKEHAAKYLSADTAEFQQAALAYQAGVNEFVRNGKTPIEFSIIGIPKTEFKPEDIYLAVGFMSFGFAEGIQADPVLDKIRREFGDAYLKDLAVQTPANAVRLKNFHGAEKKNGPLAYTGTTLRDAIEMIPVPLFTGSNGWVIDGSRTQSGFPILANDTHIGYSQPAVWYEAYIEYPGFSFYGHHLAGVPFALLGNNEFCGWGLTMFENDDTDFFRETANKENPDQVKFGDQWETMTKRDEVIKVKGESDVTLTIKTTRHGPLVNDIMKELIPDSTPVSLWWMLNHNSNESLQAAWTLNHARSFSDAQKAAALFSAPGLNVMYGDVQGNIAWWAVAKLPVRPLHVNSKLFLDGASGKDEYLGYYDFSKNPQSINPPWGYVYTANNQPDSVDGVLYPGYYYPRSRAGRVALLLSEEKKWTKEDVKKVDLDVISTMHADIAHQIADILGDAQKTEYSELAKILNSWNGDHQSSDIAPSVYYNMLSNIMRLAMVDEIGAQAYKTIMGTSIPKNSYEMFIGNELSPWWDNVNTKDRREERMDIVSQAAQQTIASLQKTSGPNSSDWTWDKIHTLKHKHPLGAVNLLDKFFSVGPFPVNGGSEVINNLHFDLDSTGYFPVNGGPALRKITDFSDLNGGESVSPTGQSGNVMSKYYKDQAEMFAYGKWRRMIMKMEAGAGSKLILKPRN